MKFNGKFKAKKPLLEQLEQQQEQMKVEIMEAMKQNGIKSFDMGEIKLTYIAQQQEKVWTIKH